MYTLKSVARRGSMLGAAFALVATLVIPAASVFADALNPLTERSLLLTSSAPGYTDTDGSGNAFGSPAEETGVPDGTYAPAGSGPNGKKSGQTFTFKISSTANVKAFSLQYCTGAAGWCQAPGDNLGDARPGATTPREVNAGNGNAHENGRSDLDIVYSGTDAADTEITPSDLVPGTDFRVTRSTDNGVTNTDITSLSDWRVGAINVEDEEYATPLAPGVDDRLTGKRNYMVIYDEGDGDGVDLQQNDVVKLILNASEDNYITNPGSGSFFVKINTYGTNTTDSWTDTIPYEDNNNIIDGGVTVANVMTDSIHITTKVLETMSFSVGTRNRDTVTLNCTSYDAQPGDPDYDDWVAAQRAGCEAETGRVHGTCDSIQSVNNNRLSLGDPNAEYSLRTDKAYEVASYWRLSSNSSGGASVYYSGNTLANTVGDEIAEIGNVTPGGVSSNPGSEQFGLAFTDISLDTYSSDFNTLVANVNTRHKFPTLELAPTVFLEAEDNYANGAGSIVPGELDEDDDPLPQARFSFVASSNTEPELIALNNDMVISCATAKMRYVANIGADTPAGVYTTKINYLAAPQY